MNKERVIQSPESKRDSEMLHETGTELRERLDESRRERAGEQNKERINDIRKEVEALSKERFSEKHEKIEHKPSTIERSGTITKKESFTAIMREAQGQMSPTSRAFSKFIHNKAVERASETAGSTVARPNAILSGAIFAFLMTLGVYLVAKNLGYPLSGFETIGAFALGWALGLVFDFLKVMVTGRK